MTDHEFRVTVEDLKTGERRIMEFGGGDYLLIPFGACHQSGLQAHPMSGTHVITIKGYRPDVAAREIDAAKTDRRQVELRVLAGILDRLPSIVLAERQERGLTQDLAATEIGIAGATLFRIESGRGCNTSTASALLRWLAGGDHD